MIKKYAVEDNCWAKLETSIDATATKIRIKETHNLPQSWEWIATLVKKQGDEIIKMEKVLVVKRELNLLTVQRGFQSTAQAWEENDVINLYITAEIIREIQRGFDKKADLINGKVPASQLPEVSQIDESNLVHKSWDETIGGNKTFNGTVWARFFNTKQDGKTNWINIWKEGELNRIDSFNDSSWFVDLNIRAKKLNFEWSSIVSNGQDWTGEWQDYTPTVSSQRGSPSLNYSSGRYKQIGKTVHCYARAEVKRNNWWGRFWISLPIPAKDYGEIISGISLVGRIGTKQESTYWYITAGGATAQILSGIWSAAHMGNLPETFQIHINLTYEAQ